MVKVRNKRQKQYVWYVYIVYVRDDDKIVHTTTRQRATTRGNALLKIFRRFKEKDHVEDIFTLSVRDDPMPVDRDERTAWLKAARKPRTTWKYDGTTLLHEETIH